MAVLDSPEKVKKAVQNFQQDTVFMKLRERWKNDFNLYRLEEYKAAKGYFAYTTNAPLVLAKKGLSLLTQSKLQISVPSDAMYKVDRTTASNMERFIYGSLYLNDDRRLKMSLGRLKNALAWFLSIRGSVFIKIYLNKNDKGETVPEIDVFDPYNVAYAPGRNGNLWVVNTRTLSQDEAKAYYGVETKKKSVFLYDCWDEKEHYIDVDDKRVVNPESHGLDYCPVFYLRAGDMPYVQQENYQYTNTHTGESIFDADRRIFPILNKVISDMITVVARGVKTPLAEWTHDGEPRVDSDIYQVEKAGVITIQVGEDIKPILQPTMPADAMNLLQFLSGEYQRGGFSHVSLGELGFRLSGFAINQLQSAIDTVVAPYSSAMEDAYRLIAATLPKQYATGKYKPLPVRGRTSKGEPFGYPEAQIIKPSEIKGDWILEVSVTPSLPKDDAQKYQLAQLAGQPDAYGQPLLSRQSRQEIVGVEDTDLEENKIDAEWAASLEVNRLKAMFDAQMERGDLENAELTLAQLQIALQALQQAGQPKPQRQPTQGMQQASMESPGVGLPAGPTGMPTEVLPSEVMGGMPGGMMNAAPGGEL